MTTLDLVQVVKEFVVQSNTMSLYSMISWISLVPAPDDTANNYAQWKEIDALVMQWIFNTVSDKYLKHILDTEATAHATWLKLEKIFLSNKKARTASLETRFYNLTLGSCSSVADYCQQLSDLANQLADVDQPISDSRLVLQLVGGLLEEFNTTATLINQQELIGIRPLQCLMMKFS
ncbi:uncharacterized protein LOC143565537 [Bidens hawaiensis]|uniref:uncharacterized protein LOC143565537 n=1 Tax=Bidens hawaiensis TaxID=980011 RepID=UPI004049AE82